RDGADRVAEGRLRLLGRLARPARQGSGAGPRRAAPGQAGRAGRGPARRALLRPDAAGRAAAAVWAGAQGLAVARHVARGPLRRRAVRERAEVEGRRARGAALAVPAEPRRVPLPARLRAALALDDAARRPDPVPAVRAGGPGRARAAHAGGTLPAGRHGAVPRR